MKENIKKVVGKVKMLMLTAALSVAGCMTALAEDGTASATVSDALREALNTVVTDFMGYVAIVLPIGLTIFGTVFGVKKGMQFFKTVSK